MVTNCGIYQRKTKYLCSYTLRRCILSLYYIVPLILMISLNCEILKIESLYFLKKISENCHSIAARQGGNTKQMLSKPKFNHQLNSTEFEVRLHSYTVIHPTTHHPPTQTQLVYSKLGGADNCPASKKGPSVQVYSHTQTSAAILYYVFAAELEFFPDKRIRGNDQVDIN